MNKMPSITSSPAMVGCAERQAAQRVRFLNYVEYLASNSKKQESSGSDDDGETDSEEIPLADLSHAIPSRRSCLESLYSDAASLKAVGQLNGIPSGKLVNLLQELDNDIQKGINASSHEGAELQRKNGNGVNGQFLPELLTVETDLALLASVIALIVLTSEDMPQLIYMEDLIEHVVTFVKRQQQNIIFPAYDPVYRTDPITKDRFSSNKKRRTAARGVNDPSIFIVFTRVNEILELLSELIQTHTLTDSVVLHLCTVGVSPFFVENVPQQQLVALKVLTAIFTKYPKHRSLVFDDILASISRLPTSKRSIRAFKLTLGSSDQIQMLTALVLQLVQSITYQAPVESKLAAGIPKKKAKKAHYSNLEAQILREMDAAICVSSNFLSSFLAKISTKEEDCDYHAVFEHFLQDLFKVTARPAWPAAEVLLRLLGNVLIKQAGDKTQELGIRSACLEYLGMVAAALRKDGVAPQLQMKVEEIIEHATGKIQNEDLLLSSSDARIGQDKLQILQGLLLEYLDAKAKQASDLSILHAKHFYAASWLKNIELTRNSKLLSPGTRGFDQKRNTRSSNSDDEDEVGASDLDDDSAKHHIIRWILSDSNWAIDCVHNNNLEDHDAGLIAHFLGSLRSSKAAQNFNYYLSTIICLSVDPVIQMRTKGLRCLAMIIEADPSVLARQDMQLWVRNAFLDHSPQVREAAVDLIGKHVLACAGLISNYCDMLSGRILDTGVGVRKRVIRTLRDICITSPEFPKVPELCVKIVKRVNDEESSVRKLVLEVFQAMWFTPVSRMTDPDQQDLLDQKVAHMIAVVDAAACDKLAMESLEAIFQSIFHPTESIRQVKGRTETDMEQNRVEQQDQDDRLITASAQLIDCIVDEILRAEEANLITHLGTCVMSLLLFARTWPSLLVRHVSVLHEYLTWKGHSRTEVQAITRVANILALVLPLIPNPADPLLAQIEEDCVKLVFRNDKMLVGASIKCLAAVVNSQTKNYGLVRELFHRHHKNLSAEVKLRREGGSTDEADEENAESLPLLRRSVYTVGLLLQHFDFNHPIVYSPLANNIAETVFEDLLYFLEDRTCTMDPELEPGIASSATASAAKSTKVKLNLQYFSLQAIGHFCVRHYEYMLRDELKDIYKQYLSDPAADSRLKSQTLANIQLYLTQEAERLSKEKREFQAQEVRAAEKSGAHDIKILDDVASGMSSTVIQLYLVQILESYLHEAAEVRVKAGRVVQLIVQQGLVNPVQILPTLIAMSTDIVPEISDAADCQMQEIHSQHPQFFQSQMMNGFRLSMQVQETIFSSAIDAHLVRGVRLQESSPKPFGLALNASVYSLMRGSKLARRGIIKTLLKQFESSSSNENLPFLLYYADNLAHFPYAILDEPFFIVHHTDIAVSVMGSNLLQAFKDDLLLVTDGDGDDDHDVEEKENMESLLARFPEHTQGFQEFRSGYQVCLLLISLMDFLKAAYGITDSRLASYSPSETSKIYDKPVNKKAKEIFQPMKSTLDALHPSARTTWTKEWNDTPQERRAITEQYLVLRDLMLQIDRNSAQDVFAQIKKPPQEIVSRATKRKQKGKGAAKKRPRRKRQRVNPSTSESEVDDDCDDSSDPDY